MSQTAPPTIEPIRRSVLVSWAPETAYRRFTEEFGGWWPRYAMSIGGKRVTRVTFECRVGGQIFEEHGDGTRFLWGRVTDLQPPHRVAFLWHSAQQVQDAQEVVITFSPQGRGTRVELVSTGWEKMGDQARRAYGGYRMSWQAVLDAFAVRSTGVRFLFNVMSTAIDAFGQRNSFIRNSHGRM